MLYIVFIKDNWKLQVQYNYYVNKITAFTEDITGVYLTTY